MEKNEREIRENSKTSYIPLKSKLGRRKSKHLHRQTKQEEEEEEDEEQEKRGRNARI